VQPPRRERALEEVDLRRDGRGSGIAVDDEHAGGTDGGQVEREHVVRLECLVLHLDERHASGSDARYRHLLLADAARRDLDERVDLRAARQPNGARDLEIDGPVIGDLERHRASFGAVAVRRMERRDIAGASTENRRGISEAPWPRSWAIASVACGTARGPASSVKMITSPGPPPRSFEAMRSAPARSVPPCRASTCSRRLATRS
jgi:hypothetical protein